MGSFGDNGRLEQPRDATHRCFAWPDGSVLEGSLAVHILRAAAAAAPQSQCGPAAAASSTVATSSASSGARGPRWSQNAAIRETARQRDRLDSMSTSSEKKRATSHLPQYDLAQYEAVYHAPAPSSSSPIGAGTATQQGCQLNASQCHIIRYSK